MCDGLNGCPAGPEGPEGPPGRSSAELEAEEELEFNVGAIRGLKLISQTIVAAEYAPTPEFCARLAELNGVCARFFNPPPASPDEGTELERAHA